MSSKSPSLIVNKQLVSDVRELIQQSKSRIATTINSELTQLYWSIGKRVKTEILKHERADYGERVVKELADTLRAAFGKGFERTSLVRMIKFFDCFPDQHIGATVSHQLTWSHIIELLPLKDSLKRDFYAEMCRIERWSVRTLREKIGKLLYERTAISQQPEEVIKDSLMRVKSTDKMSPQMLMQDPYILDFLNLPPHYDETKLETAILDEIQKFLLELGAGFCFVARQKRISVGRDDFWIDLLLYNRYLRRLVVIELKNTPFKPAHKGQMEFYLQWLDQHEKHGDDEKPLGIILCTAKDKEQVTLLEMEKSGIHVAEYWVALPPKDVFERKIHEIVENTRARLECLINNE